MEIKKDERIDDLGIENLKIIQNKKVVMKLFIEFRNNLF